MIFRDKVGKKDRRDQIFSNNVFNLGVHHDSAFDKALESVSARDVMHVKLAKILKNVLGILTQYRQAIQNI